MTEDYAAVARKWIAVGMAVPVDDVNEDSPTLRRLVAALLSAHAAGRAEGAEAKWLPIETAPKDGTPVIVARHNDTFGWVRGWSHWVDVRGIAGWISHGFFEVPDEPGLGHPTHWQPLPLPPSGDKI